MQNGFIFKVIDALILSLNYLNIAEFFKFVAKKLTPTVQSVDEIKKNCNIAIDIFIILKWFLVIFLWVQGINNPILTVIVFYLVWSNFHTYFYYHIWKENNSSNFDRSRRRFINLIIAIAFTIISFGYLYSTAFINEYIWGETSFSILKALIFSISQSLFLNISSVTPKNINGEVVTTIQSIITFLFVVIILAKSIPQDCKDTKSK